jgi:hypothetical protein
MNNKKYLIKLKEHNHGMTKLLYNLLRIMKKGKEKNLYNKTK